MTLAALMFIVASGFSLIFGLMRVVNMAHGSFLLLGGYIAYEVQQAMAGGGGLTLFSSDINAWEWVVPAVVAMAAIGALGLILQQVFLRWNMGQDLRQALITIALSVIIADQIVAHFPTYSSIEKGSAVNTSWPGSIDRLVNLHVAGVSYSVAKLTMIALGRAVGNRALALALSHEDRHGHPRGRRRPADDLGARRQHPGDVRDRLRRRGVARRPRRVRLRVVRRCQPDNRRPVAAQLARRRHRGRAGLDLRHRRRRASYGLVYNFSIAYLSPDDERRLLHAVLDRAHVRAPGPRARIQTAGVVREARVSASRGGSGSGRRNR